MSILDQLNTTVHGTVKVTPYELVFGQPPRQNIFPGVKSERIMEEDVEDLFEEVKDSERDDAPGGRCPEWRERRNPGGERYNTQSGERDDAPGRERDDTPGGEGDDARNGEVSANENTTVQLASTEKHRKLREEADKGQCGENATEVLQRQKKEDNDVSSWELREC